MDKVRDEQVNSVADLLATIPNANPGFFYAVDNRLRTKHGKQFVLNQLGLAGTTIAIDKLEPPTSIARELPAKPARSNQE